MDYGNGSIRQRRKAGKNAWVWELRVNLGSDPTTGKRRQASRMFTGTKTAAADALRELRTDMAEQRGEVHTMATLFDDWIEMVLVPTRRPGTVTGARSAVSAVLKPALGHLAVETLKSGDLDTFYTDQRKAGKKPGTIRRYHSQISAALQVATDWGWRPDNPARKAHPPAPEPARVRPPTADDVQRLIGAAAAKDPAIGIALLVLAITGLRRGEVLGLQWRDVNMVTGTIDVRRIINRGTPGGPPVIAEPKTARSRAKGRDPGGRTSRDADVPCHLRRQGHELSEPTDSGYGVRRIPMARRITSGLSRRVDDHDGPVVQGPRSRHVPVA